MNNNNYVIETKGLSKSYKDIEVLSSLNLKISKNSIFGFLGPNGAGKTTTIKLLLGLIKPNRGSGTVFGNNIVSESLEIRTRVGYLPQDPRFYDHLSAREILRFNLKFFFSGPMDSIEERIEEMLDLVDLPDKADRPIKSFSGGERQRLGIAQAQINYPDLLILDEPAASLDPIGRRDVLRVMEKLQEHTTIFYCTHILDDVQKVSDTVAILNQGELIVQGPIEEILSDQEGTVFEITMKGNENSIDAIYAQALDMTWINNIAIQKVGNRFKWHVNVSDEDVAENRLLRTILKDENVDVTKFGKKKYDLEDAFMRIIEGSKGQGGVKNE
ncbi:MAG: ABC transporter ATP-binding protein [Candidatus Kariarchaeaceae archaeon]|jgi:ABC-2 type transport system ATP-binding protein